METKIKNLVFRHVFLTCENYLEHRRTFTEAIDRIEREYIVLTGFEIKNNPAHTELLKKRCEFLNIPIC